MTHIPSVVEAYDFLGRTVADCRRKLGDRVRFTVEPEGIEITISAPDGLTNRELVPWWRLVECPAELAFHTGTCAGELLLMRQARDVRRRENDSEAPSHAL